MDKTKLLVKIVLSPLHLLELFRERQIATVMGVPIIIGSSLFIFCAVLLAMGAWKVIPFMAVVWFVVTLHEIGHVWAAKGLGWKCNSITLVFIGGMAEVELNVFEPRKEFLVAVAGPIVNLILVALTLPLVLLPIPHPYMLMLSFFIEINVMLVLFNILPIWPMDGGRVVRSMLTVWNGDVLRSTRITKWVGRATAIPTFAFCWMNGWVLGMMIVPIMVLLASHEERRIIGITRAYLDIPDGGTVDKILVDEVQRSMVAKVITIPAVSDTNGKTDD